MRNLGEMYRDRGIKIRLTSDLIDLLNSLYIF